MLWLTGLGVMHGAPKRVLILNSFGRDVAPFSAVASACKTTMARELETPVEFYEVSLDLARVGDPEMEAATAQYLEFQLKHRPMDLVVSIGSPAIRFSVLQREHLFPGTPLVFTGAEPRMVRPEFLRTNATMIVQTLNVPGMVTDLLQLRPDTTNVVVIFGKSPLEQLWAAEWRREFAVFTNQLTFTFLRDQSLERMEQLVANLPPHSFILHGLLIVDAADVPYEREESLKRLRAVANAPIFAPFQSEFGLGIVGGHLYQDELMGIEAARVAIRILRGEQPELIPRLLDKAVPRYDWRELNRWGISESVLPPGSVVSFRQSGFWEAYGGRTLLVLAFVLVQSGLIGGLLVSWRRKRKWETISSLVAELSTRFVNLPAGEVDREIEQAQRRLCECLRVETAGLWQWTSTLPREMILTHLHLPPNGPKAPGRLSAQEVFPWLLEQALKGKTVVIDTDDIPLAAARDLATRRRYGVKSSVLLPLAAGGQPILGVLTINSLSARRTWSKEIVLQLELIAQLFTNALVRKSAEQALRESELRLSLATDSAGVGIWELDCRTWRFWATERALSLFGYAATEIVSQKRFEELVYPDDRDHVRRALGEALRHGECINVEYRILLADGRIKWIASQGRPYFRSSGEPERILGVSTDITERKQAAERWRLTVEAMPNGVILVDQSGRIVLVNTQAEQIFGYAPQELLGLSIETVIPERFRDRHPEERRQFAARPHARPMGVGRELFARRKDGSEFPVEVGLQPIQSDQGTLILSVLVDISQRRRMEQEAHELQRELAHTGRVTLLGQLASALAHELSQPLGAILRNAEAADVLMQQSAPDLEELRAIITDIQSDDRRAGNVIERLRSLLKRQALDLQEVELPGLIAGALSLVRGDAQSRQIRLSFSAPKDLPTVLGDRVHLQQVLLNLVLNAMDAMTVPTGRPRTIAITARATEAGQVEVSVCDNGSGIAPEHLDRLFEPFFTTKAHGMGMGLPVSKTIIAAHRGKLWAENRSEGGSIFRFTMLIAKNGAAK